MICTAPPKFSTPKPSFSDKFSNSTLAPVISNILVSPIPLITVLEEDSPRIVKSSVIFKSEISTPPTLAVDAKL